MTEFAFRALAKEPYLEVIEALGRIAAGERAALQELLGRTRAALSEPSLQRRNAHSRQLRLWDDWLATAPEPSKATAEKLAEIAVAVLCCVDFQSHPLAGEEPSPHLVVLGDSDGGLFGVLTERVPWFESWLIESLSQRAERFGYGRNMFRLSDRDLPLLHDALPALASHCSEAAQPEYCRATLDRLSHLLESARSHPSWEIACSEAG
jgi:hypothetical protein